MDVCMYGWMGYHIRLKFHKSNQMAGALPLAILHLSFNNGPLCERAKPKGGGDGDGSGRGGGEGGDGEGGELEGSRVHTVHTYSQQASQPM